MHIPREVISSGGRWLLAVVGLVLLVGALCRVSGFGTWEQIGRALELIGVLIILVGGYTYIGGLATERPGRRLSDQYVSTSWGEDTLEAERAGLRYRAAGCRGAAITAATGLLLLLLGGFLSQVTGGA